MEMRNASVSVRSIDGACYDRKRNEPKTEKLKYDLVKAIFGEVENE